MGKFLAAVAHQASEVEAIAKHLGVTIADAAGPSGWASDKREEA